MEQEEIKCFIILDILAVITIVLVAFFAWSIEYYPLNIYFILLVFACDVILSGYFIVKISKIVKRKT